MIMDQRVVFTGSFDFTASGETRNIEDGLLIKSTPALIQQYIDNYNKRKAVSIPFLYGFHFQS